jgi:hypothetical protein
VDKGEQPRMRETLKWRSSDEVFEDGSRLSDWEEIEQGVWQWQYDHSIHRIVKTGRMI